MLRRVPAACSLLCLWFLALSVSSLRVDYPWTYDEDLFGGPDFWGLVNREWRMCKVGQAQSPINVDPAQLLFDPHLGELRVDRTQADTVLENVGQMPLVRVNDSSPTGAVNISGGPALPYRYRLSQIIVHFGKTGGGEKGSEHTIDRVRFPAEIQLLAFNSDLYVNFMDAMTQPRGLLGISVIVDLGRTTDPELRRLTVASQSITYKGSSVALSRFRPAGLLPKTTNYVTYEGSLTFPGCHESVTWVIMNNPIYITKEDLSIWNELQQSETKQATPVPMAPVYRPLKPLNGRLIRTNINVHYKKSSSSSATCPSSVYSDLGYRANAARRNASVAAATAGLQRRGVRDVDEAVVKEHETDRISITMDEDEWSTHNNDVIL